MQAGGGCDAVADGRGWAAAADAVLAPRSSKGGMSLHVRHMYETYLQVRVMALCCTVRQHGSYVCIRNRSCVTQWSKHAAGMSLRTRRALCRGSAAVAPRHAMLLRFHMICTASTRNPCVKSRTSVPCRSSRRKQGTL